MREGGALRLPCGGRGPSAHIGFIFRTDSMPMVRLFPLLVIVSLVATPGRAQSKAGGDENAEAAIRGTIEALFDGMRAGDGHAVRAVFHEEARLHTATGPQDSSALQSTSLGEFVSAVEQSHDAVWDERVWDVEIRVDGPLASAWVPYVFYHGDERSHCGVNAIQLVRGDDGWRILQITDTRRQTCDVPTDVRK